MDQTLKLNDLFKVLCVVSIWGFNFVALKYAVSDMPPIFMTIVRFSLTALLLCYFFRPDFALMKKMLPISMVMGIGHFGMLYMGVSGIDGATAAILIQLGAPFSVLLACLVFKEKLEWLIGLGIAVSFVGAVFLAGEPQGGSIWSGLLIVFSAFCWAWANILIKKANVENPISVIFWVNFLAIPGLIILSLLFEDNQIHHLMNSHLSNWLALIYTILASSLLAYYLWYKLLANYQVNKIVPYSLAVPFIGAISTTIVFVEPLTLYKVIGGALTIGGVSLIYISQLKSKKQKTEST